ncbi:UNVERIFIED_CONTAM: hypothetical protein HDU68_003870 [Siphonaria sp. JEL0065]|nr:hypothetical protein HDU68_003870 [Siphonaria sp. JEL0065]
MGLMDKYEIIKELGDGTFGSVLMATNKKNGETVAIKQIKRKIENWDELREVKALSRLGKHVNIIKLKEVIRDHRLDELNYVFEYMEGNLFDKMREVEAGGYMMEEYDVKKYSFQLLQGLKYMHNSGIFHRDLKPENLLVKGHVLKIADFGLAREIRGDPHTEYVTTRWYRAPEILLKASVYSAMMDRWSVGTIIAEFTTLQALFPGSSEIDQIFKICSLVGTPLENDADENLDPEEVDNRGYYTLKQCPERSEIQGGGAWSEGIKLAEAMGFTFPVMNAVPLEQIMDHAPTESLQLIADMLLYDPNKRPSASEALEHPWFLELWNDPFYDVEDVAVSPMSVKQIESRTSAGLTATDSETITPPYSRSRESTVVERPAYRPSNFSRKSSHNQMENLPPLPVHPSTFAFDSRKSSCTQVEDIIAHNTHSRHESTETVNERILARRNSKLHIEDIVKRNPKISASVVTAPNIKERGALMNSAKVEKEKQFIQQRRELSALEKVAVDAVQSLAVKQKQLQQHLQRLAKSGEKEKAWIGSAAKASKKKLMEKIQDAHTEKRAVDAVQSLVLQQKQLQRHLEKLAVERDAKEQRQKEESVSPPEVIKKSSKAATKTSTYGAKRVSNVNKTELLGSIPPLSSRKTDKRVASGRKLSDSEQEWGYMKEFDTVLENIEYFGNGKKEHQKYRRTMIQFLRNLESENVVTNEFLDTPISEEDVGFPADWKTKSVEFGARLKEKIGELVCLYNEYFYEMEGIANESHQLYSVKGGVVGK